MKLTQGTSGPSTSPWGRLGRVGRICRKELRESLRDRRTLATLVLMPLIVYPLLSITLQRFLLTSATHGALRVVIGVSSDAEGEQLRLLLPDVAAARADSNSRVNVSGNAPDTPPAEGDVHGQWEADEATTASTRFAKDRTTATKDSSLADSPSRGIQLDRAPWDGLDLQAVLVENVETAVSENLIDVGLEFSLEEGAGPNTSPPAVTCRVTYHRDSYRANKLVDWLRVRLYQLNQQYLQDRLIQLQQSARLPVKLSRHELEADSKNDTGLATVIPLILVLMTVTGAVYPAIDLTAGERERGTLEALVSAPIPRWSVLFAKYVAVMAVAALTATANLIAMMITLYSAGLTEAILGRPQIPWLTILLIFGLMLLLASFFASVLLAITSFARSFKEAQAYIVPAILLSLAPCLICLAPGIELNGILAVTPLVNIVLFARDAFTSEAHWSFLPLIIVSTGLYAAAAIGIAARIFGSDAILYGSQTGIRELFLSRQPTPQSVPSLSGAIVFLALLVPLYVLTASSIAVRADVSMRGRLVTSSFVTLVLFVLLPWLTTRLLGFRSSVVYRLRRAPIVAAVAAVLLGLSLWPWIHEVVVSTRLESPFLGASKWDIAQQFLDQLRQLPLAFVLLNMAIVPAVGEEFFFRGFLLSAFQAKLRSSHAILLTAILFGLFHVLATSALAVERLVPSSLIGIVLGWVCWRTQSLWPGIILHATHNGILTTIAYYQPAIDASGWFGAAQEHLPAKLLAGSACLALFGVTGIHRLGRMTGTRK